MGRRRDALYAGAVGRCDLARVAGLSGYMLQPKLDGAYCVATTDDRGRLSAMVTRNGKPLPRAVRAEFAGVEFARPNSVLVGEVEAYTEAAQRTAKIRGTRRLWVFDALRVNGRDISSDPFSARRDTLMRAYADWYDSDDDRPWTDDASGRAHDAAGKFCRRIPKAWRRMPIAPQMHPSHVEAAWSEWVESGDMPCEGLVAVAMSAPLGKRRSKLKVKQTTTIDAVCLESDGKAARMLWREAGATFTVPVKSTLGMRAGTVYEVAHESFYESGEPRFARLVRARCDLTA